MTSPRAVVLDNEAVQALRSTEHPKHRRALAFVEATLARRRGRGQTPVIVVPTSVRVEAAWDRRAPGAAIVNRLRIIDHPLDRDAADRAAALRDALAVSVADAHVGSAVAAQARPVAVITSDVDDMRRVVAHLEVDAVVVRL